MKIRELGKRLERNVRFCTTNISGPVDCVDLSNSVVLVLCSENVGVEELEHRLREVAASAPLVILLAEGALAGFDYLLETLAQQPSPHIMTYVCEDGWSAAVEMLLTAIWPAEERFDEWRDYVVLVIGDKTLANKTETEVTRMLR